MDEDAAVFDSLEPQECMPFDSRMDTRLMCQIDLHTELKLDDLLSFRHVLVSFYKLV
jgi:hypothetical protein